MLRALPNSFFSNSYRIVDQDGNAVASLKLSNWKEKATLSILDQQMQIYREGAFSGRFVLEHEGEVLAAATKPSAWKDRFEIQLGSHPYELKPESWLRTSYVVKDDSTPVGTMKREGWLTRKTRVDLPEDWPLGVQVFALWLVLMMWRRAAAAAS